MLKNLYWLGHASFKIITSTHKVLYIDPWKLPRESEVADIILVTHEHYDHLSPSDIEKIKKEDTEILAPENCQDKLSEKVKGVKPGDKLEVKGLKIEVVPAYNVNKDFHPKTNQWVGYIVEIDGQRIYHAGDTDLIPEMKNIKADIALLPVSGVYVMNATEAAQAADLIKPAIAVPMHYGEIVGTEKDAEIFAQQANCEVKILTKE